MRWYGQLAVIAVLGAAGYGGWRAYQSGVAVGRAGLGAYLPAAGRAAEGANGSPRPRRRSSRSMPSGPGASSRSARRSARCAPSNRSPSPPRRAGIVQKISFEEGQKVKAGDVLLRLDDEERRADIEQAQAEIQRAMAQRDESSARLERAVALRRTGAGTEAQVTDLTAQVKTLESAIASAEARRQAAEARLEDVVVRAPFAGRLGTRSVSVGAYSSPGTRITTLDDLSRVRLDFAVPENLLGQLQPGQIVRATSAAYGQRAFEGKVSVIDPRVDPVTRSVRLTAEFPNPDEALKPGMFLSVALDRERPRPRRVIPEEAVVGEGLRHLVYVVKDNVVERRVVRIGQRQEGRVEIVEGLQPGETIIVRGVQRVRPGLTVTPKPIRGRASPVRRGGSGSERGGRSGRRRVRRSRLPRPQRPRRPPGRGRGSPRGAGPPRTSAREGADSLGGGRCLLRPRGEEGSARRAQSTRPKPA